MGPCAAGLFAVTADNAVPLGMRPSMFTWSVPPQSIVVFCFGSLAIKDPKKRRGFIDVPYKEQEQLVKALCESCGLEYIRIGSYKLPFHSPRWPHILDQIERAHAEKVVGLTACWIEEPKPSPVDPHTWFELETSGSEFRFSRRPPNNTHYTYGEDEFIASDQFRQIVQKHALTGLEFLPLEDARPSDPSRWHEVFAYEPIGRGLDHPLCDHLIENKSCQEYGRLARRLGNSIADFRNWRKEIGFADSLMPRLTRAACFVFRDLFRVQGPRRFTREYLPRTDFAYEGWYDHLKDGGPGGYGRGGRGIACNARARRILIESGVMKARQFKALATVPVAEANAVILDSAIKHPLPPPVYTRAEAAEERSRRERIIASAVATPSPPTFRSTNEAVSEFARCIEAGTLPWRPLSASGLLKQVASSGLWPRTPLAWRTLSPFLPASILIPSDRPNGEPGEFGFDIVAPTWNQWVNPDDVEGPASDRPSKSDLVLARAPSGDWLSVRVRRGGPARDGRIQYWDHETCRVAEDWPSVRAFAAWLLEHVEQRR